MPVKCDQCGVETEIPESFSKQRKSFTRRTLLYCPDCRTKQHERSTRGLFIWQLGIGAAGLLLVLLAPEQGAGWVFLNIFLFQMFNALSILPHELGHAWAGRWLGLRVFKVYIGSGQTWLTGKLLGFPIEFRRIPLGGLTVATHRNKERFRGKQFVFILAGPLVNFALIAAVLPFINSEHLWSILPLQQRLEPALVFFYSNLAILLENLWPHTIQTSLGQFHSDGKQLWQSLFLTREKQQQNLIATFALEIAECHQQGDLAAAQSWLEKGLAQYPESELLLNWQGVIMTDRGNYAAARQAFLNLLTRESNQPFFRPLMLNNVAYANALLCKPELLDEADRFSQEALASIGWIPAVKGTRGAVLIALGRFDEGINLLKESMAQAINAGHKAQNACLIAIGEVGRAHLAEAEKYLDAARKLDSKCILLERAESALRAAAATVVVL